MTEVVDTGFRKSHALTTFVVIERNVVAGRATVHRNHSRTANPLKIVWPPYGYVKIIDTRTLNSRSWEQILDRE